MLVEQGIVADERGRRVVACKHCAQPHSDRGLTCSRCRYERRDKAKAHATAMARKRALAGEARSAYLEAKRIDGARRRAVARTAKGGLTLAEIMAQAAAKRQAAKDAKVAARQAAQAARVKAKPWTAPGLTGAEKWRIRYDIDPLFNMQQRFRAHARRGRFGKWRRLGCHLRDAMVKGRDVSTTYAPLIDYTAQDLMAHMQRQFTKRMTWAKFCAGAIHIDHRIPLASFDMTDEAQARAAWALSNLQPLWAKANMTKGPKRTVLL